MGSTYQESSVTAVSRISLTVSDAKFVLYLTNSQCVSYLNNSHCAISHQQSVCAISHQQSMMPTQYVLFHQQSVMPHVSKGVVILYRIIVDDANLPTVCLTETNTLERPTEEH